MLEAIDCLSSVFFLRSLGCPSGKLVLRPNMVAFPKWSELDSLKIRHVARDPCMETQRGYFLNCEGEALIVLEITRCWRCQSHGVPAKDICGRANLRERSVL